jgi:hypothetical protein
MTTSPNPEELDRFITSVLFHEWRSQLAIGGLTVAGIARVRAELDGNAFLPTPQRELMRREIDDAYAAARGWDPDDMPGRDPIPDDVSELDEPPT